MPNRFYLLSDVNCGICEALKRQKWTESLGSKTETDMGI